MSAIQKPTAPSSEHVAYWQSKGWKHTGLGIFKNKHNDRGRLHVHKDGSTSMRVLNFCAIGNLSKKRAP